MYYYEDDGWPDLARPDPEEPYCPTCEASLLWEDCEECGGEGSYDGGEEDPLWYSLGQRVSCGICDGFGGWYRCTDTHSGKRLWMPNELSTD